jgi:hypothetical protein
MYNLFAMDGWTGWKQFHNSWSINNFSSVFFLGHSNNTDEPCVKLKGISRWLLFNANSALFQLYHGQNKLIFNEMMMRSAMYLTNTFGWIFIVLSHWKNRPRIDISPHSDTYPDSEPTSLCFFSLMIRI